MSASRAKRTLGGDDDVEGIKAVLHSQAKNTRTKGVKTYHLVVDFRPEDEDRLSPEVFYSAHDGRRRASSCAHAALKWREKWRRNIVLDENESRSANRRKYKQPDKERSTEWSW